MDRTDHKPRAADQERGIAIIELALSLPVLLILVMGLTELCGYVIQKQKLSSVALKVADNAGRMGATGFGGPQRVTEAEINDVLLGGMDTGKGLDMERNGRIILSSLETNESNGQWIHWQRCAGALAHRSSFGEENQGADGTAFDGMGPTDAKVHASPRHPAMFVEIAYRWRPITPLPLIATHDMVEIASMPVRIERDLTKLENGTGATSAQCQSNRQ